MDDFNLNFSILQDDEQQLGFGKKEQRQKITWLPQVEKKRVQTHGDDDVSDSEFPANGSSLVLLCSSSIFQERKLGH